MTFGAIFLTLLTCLIIPLSMTNQWFMSRGKLQVVYPLNLTLYCLFFTMDVYLAVRDTAQLSMLLFVIPYAWAGWMSIKGIKRLQVEKKLKKSK